MLARLWPTSTGMLAAAATAIGLHSTTFLTAVFTALVGAVVSCFGFYLQWRWKQQEHAKDDIIHAKDVQIEWLYKHLEEATQKWINESTGTTPLATGRRTSENPSD